MVDRLIDMLTGSARDRDQGLLELKHLREYAVTHLLRRAIAEDRTLPVEIAISTLVAIGEPAVQPLIGALRTGPEKVRGIAADALGRIGGKDAELALYGPALSPTTSQALRSQAMSSLALLLTGDASRVGRVSAFGVAERVRKEAEVFFTHQKSLPRGEDGLVGIWTWDAPQNLLVETRTAPPKADLFIAEQLARESLDLSGNQEEPQVLLMAILLARDVEAAAGTNRCRKDQAQPTTSCSPPVPNWRMKWCIWA